MDVFIFIIYRTLILAKSFVMKATIKANPNTSLLPVMKKSRNNMRVGLFPILAVEYSVRLEHKRSFIKWKIVYPMKLQDSVEGENETQGSFIIHLPPSQGRAFLTFCQQLTVKGRDESVLLVTSLLERHYSKYGGRSVVRKSYCIPKQQKM